jgi:hypothetical protein
MTKRAAPEGLLRAERVRMLEAELAPHMRDWGIARASTFDAFVRANAALLEKRPTDDTARVTLDEVAIAEYRAAAVRLSDVTLVPGGPSLGALMHDQLDSIRYVRFETLLEILRRCSAELAKADEGDDTLTWLYLYPMYRSNAWFSAYLWHTTGLRADFIIASDTLELECKKMTERHGFTRHRFLYVDDGSFSGSQVATFFDEESNRSSDTTLIPVLAFCTADARDTIDSYRGKATVEWLKATIVFYQREDLNPAFTKSDIENVRAQLRQDAPGYSAVLEEWVKTARHDRTIVCEHKLADTTSLNAMFLLEPSIPLSATESIHGKPLVVIHGNVDAEPGTAAFYKWLQWYTQSADGKEAVETFHVPLGALASFAAAAAVAPLACAVCAAPATQRCTQCGLAAYCANGSGCQRTHWQALGHAAACTRYAHKTRK